MKNELEYSSYRPGALADVVRMHLAYYSENWGFGKAFEVQVAGGLSEFLGRFRVDADLFLTVYASNGKCVGSVSLDSKHAEDKGAHVRWFIVDQEFAGQGVGRQLMTRVVNHCDSVGFPRSYLSTFKGLHAARKLYESLNYKLIKESDTDQWAGGVKEQLFVRDLEVL